MVDWLSTSPPSSTDDLRLWGVLVERVTRGCIHGCLSAAVALYLLGSGLGVRVRGRVRDRVRARVRVRCEGSGLGVGLGVRGQG